MQAFQLQKKAINATIFYKLQSAGGRPMLAKMQYDANGENPVKTGSFLDESKSLRGMILKELLSALK